MQLNNIVIMAAAGAGKTHDICKEVIENAKTTNKKILITTYTNKGIESIEKEYKKQNNGVIDKNVVVLSWFQFLLRELVKPYQSSILNKINIINSIDFNHQYGYINFNSRGTPKHYMFTNNILSNTVSEFAIDSNIKSNNKVMQRLEEIYSHIYIDEIQDLAGEDIEILTEKGESVKSKSEKIIADKLNMMNIPYCYEVPLYLKGYGYVKPDFKVLNVATRKEYYWEHYGMMDNKDYIIKALKKKNSYISNNFIVGDNLIETYESQSCPLDTRNVEKIIKTFLV